MRILVVTNLYPPQVLGGYERSIADLARLLQHRGHTVLVLTSDTPEFCVAHTSLYPEPPVQRCFSLLGRWTSQGARWLEFEQVKATAQQNQAVLQAHLQSFQPEVCLAGNLLFLQTEAEILEQILAKAVPIAHYIMDEKPNFASEHTPQQSIYRFVTCSDWVTERLRSAGYPSATAQTIYPGAEVDVFHQTALPPRDRLRIAYASLVGLYKGTDVLVEALALLQAAEIPFTATIAGGTFQPDFAEALKQFVESEGLSANVKFSGALSRQDLIQLYKTHNVLVFPSRFPEPFGISQIEAMAAGLTLVTSGTGGAREIVAEPGIDALLFDSENPLDLADVLSTLPNDPTRWQAIAQAGQQRALTEFSQAQATEQIEAVLLELIALKEVVYSQPTAIKLHLGGKQAHPDWKILDIEARPEVDFVGDAADLSQFADESVEVIYASHILEHFHYRLRDELQNTLKEWYRVLQPGGQLMVSVPNLQTLCWLYLQPNLKIDLRYHLMRIMFGGQHNEYDVHRVGFDLEILAWYLQKVGFEQCMQVPEFGLFDDFSSMTLMNMPISLNLIATKPSRQETLSEPSEPNTVELLQSIQSDSTAVERSAKYKEYQIGRYCLLLPIAHKLDDYQTRWKRYDTALGFIAQAVFQKYPDSFAIDIGANVGDSAALIRSFADISVLCIEGNPDFIDCLEQNISRIGNIDVEQCFVGNEGDSVDLDRILQQGGTATIVDAVHSEGTAIAEMKSLETILQKHSKFVRSKLLKIDTDGFDFSIINASADVIARLQPVLYFEYDVTFKPTAIHESLQAMQTLISIGYESFLVYDNFGNYLMSLSHQDLEKFADLNAYLVSNRSKSGTPAVYYFDICAFVQNDRDLFEQLRASEVAGC